MIRLIENEYVRTTRESVRIYKDEIGEYVIQNGGFKDYLPLEDESIVAQLCVALNSALEAQDLVRPEVLDGEVLLVAKPCCDHNEDMWERLAAQQLV